MILTGLSVNKGTVKGKLVSLGEEGIVLAKTIPITEVHLLTKAKGVILEKGGILDHVAIFAREFNIPCVVKVQNATRYLRPGMEVVLNADEGKIIALGVEKEIENSPEYIMNFDNLEEKEIDGVKILIERYNGRNYVYFPNISKEEKQTILAKLGKNFVEARPVPPATVCEKYVFYWMIKEGDEEFHELYRKMKESTSIHELNDILEKLCEKVRIYVMKSVEEKEKKWFDKVILYHTILFRNIFVDIVEKKILEKCREHDMHISEFYGSEKPELSELKQLALRILEILEDKEILTHKGTYFWDLYDSMVE
jgi:phosphohistidine swiveling domain-containing protein